MTRSLIMESDGEHVRVDPQIMTHRERMAAVAAEDAKKPPRPHRIFDNLDGVDPAIARRLIRAASAMRGRDAKGKPVWPPVTARAAADVGLVCFYGRAPLIATPDVTIFGECSEARTRAQRALEKLLAMPDEDLRGMLGDLDERKRAALIKVLEYKRGRS